MPKKCEYLKPDGSIGYFHDWTEEWNKAAGDAEKEIRNDPEKMAALKKRAEQFAEATKRKALEKRAQQQKQQ